MILQRCRIQSQDQCLEIYFKAAEQARALRANQISESFRTLDGFARQAVLERSVPTRCLLSVAILRRTSEDQPILISIQIACSST